MHQLRRCLNPSSIAVVGGKEAERVVQQCQKLGFEGEIWPVNPHRQALAGIPCFDSVGQLPGAPDVAYVAIPASPSVDVIAQLSNMATGGVICYASGFREVGATDLHQRLMAAAGDMPLIGPNCYGYINALNGAALWPDQHGLKTTDKGVAIFSSSGNVSINMTLQQRALPIALILTVGNQAMVGIEHCIEAVLDDDRITAIGIHIEGLRDLQMFTQLAQRAAAKKKPIIVLKTGRSEIGARITMSHTATLAGEAALYDHYFSRLGVAQTDTLENFLEALKLVSITGPLGNGHAEANRIASMSCSGGEASLMADISIKRGLHFPPLEEEHRKQIQSTLNEYVNVDNPLDYHTFIWGDQQRMTETFSAMLAGGFALTVLLLDYPYVNGCDMQEWIDAGNAFVEACRRTGQKGAVVCSLTENMPASVRDELMTKGVVPLLGLDQAQAAIRAATEVCQISATLPGFSAIAGYAGERRALTEYAAKAALSEAGLPISEMCLVASESEVVGAADRIGYPVVLKVSGETLAHKTEVGGVALNLSNAEQVAGAARRLLTISKQVLVEKMYRHGVAELLLGISFDPMFGHYLILGYGGAMVELIADRQILLLPVSRDQIRQALLNLKTAKLLTGFRNQPVADLDAAVEATMALVNYVQQNRDNVLEIDINPLILGPEGGGAVVADALIVNRI